MTPSNEPAAAFAPISRKSLPHDTVALARFLLGKQILRRLPGGIAGGRIVETEAYLPDDAASHTFRGMTARNRTMFGRRGHAYVYLCYGVSWMLNISGEREGIGAGVLIRAMEPQFGIPLMMAQRGTQRRRDLTRGPGRLAMALQIDRALDGVDLCAPGPLFLHDPAEPPPAIVVSRRIGIARDAHLPLRFAIPGSAYVSGTARANAVVDESAPLPLPIQSAGKSTPPQNR